MKRRDFISVLGGAAAWPIAARAQQSGPPHRIGVMLGFEANDPEAHRYIAAFKEGLQNLGWIDGRNIEFDYRWPAADPERIRAGAIELVGTRPRVILVNSTPATRLLHRETQTVPVLFVNIADPIRSGFVTSLANPGGNLTGFTNFEPAMGGKWLELLKEIAPDRTRTALLFNPSTHSGQYFRLIETVALSLRMESIQLPAQDAAEIEHAIASLGLISYGLDDADLFRRAASYVDRILRGAKPADLPVQAPSKFELVINLKSAKALGLDVPWFLQQRADEVIE